MDIVYILSPVLFLVLIYFLVMSIRNLIESKKELKQIKGSKGGADNGPNNKNGYKDIQK